MSEKYSGRYRIFFFIIKLKFKVKKENIHTIRTGKYRPFHRKGTLPLAPSQYKTTSISIYLIPKLQKPPEAFQIYCPHYYSFFFRGTKHPPPVPLWPLLPYPSFLPRGPMQSRSPENFSILSSRNF